MILLDIIVSFICAASASLGIGGGGLIVVYLTKIKGLPQKQAQGINLLFFVVTMSVTLIYHKLKGRIITRDIHRLLIPCIPGGILGSILANELRGETLKALFGAFLVLCGIRFIFTEIKSFSKEKKNHPKQ